MPTTEQRGKLTPATSRDVIQGPANGIAEIDVPQDLSHRGRVQQMLQQEIGLATRVRLTLDPPLR